jgi:hypothetical protein
LIVEGSVFANQNLNSFSEHARQRLREHTNTFMIDLVSEAERIESAQNSRNETAEVTASMVDDAALIIRKTLRPKKRRLRHLLGRVAAAVMPLLLGLFFDPSRLSDATYAAIIIPAGVITIVIVTIVIILD